MNITNDKWEVRAALLICFTLGVVFGFLLGQ